MISEKEGKIIAGRILIDKYGKNFLLENIDRMSAPISREDNILNVYYGVFEGNSNVYPPVERDGGIYVDEVDFPTPLMTVSVNLKDGTAKIIKE